MKSSVKTPIKTSQLLNIKKAAEELGVAEVTMRLYITHKKVRVVRIGGLVRITREEIERVKTKGFRVHYVRPRKEEVIFNEQ